MTRVDAYLAAGEAMLAAVHQLIAVWDGAPDSRPGSTADIVRAARQRGLPVEVVWPIGARRG